MIAALFVEKNGCYAGLPGVDVWDIERDARKYEGPYSVVAHPPCTRWCMLAGLVQARYGYKIGEDEGCFESALSSVRKWGGVLEHPAFTKAWRAHNLNHPPSTGGWVNADWLGGWTCCVEQSKYGHVARKATWLYAYGVELPSLRWGCTHGGESDALVSWCCNKTKKSDKRKRIGKKRAAATPIEFRDLLISMAESVEG